MRANKCPSITLLAALMLALFGLVVNPCRAQSDPVLRVAAAANLQKVLTEAIVPAFEKRAGAIVVPTFASTKLLAVQLENGSPNSVFISADTQTVTQLTLQGILIPGTARVYAIGRLVLWTRADVHHHPHALRDLADPAYQKIAIANPALAPYGLAAQQSLAAAGLTAAVAPRLVQAENIGAALQFAQSGNADAALTALSLVVEDTRDPYIIIPDRLHAPLAQSAALVKNAPNLPLARRFLQFLISREAAPLWRKYGYSLP